MSLSGTITRRRLLLGAVGLALLCQPLRTWAILTHSRSSDGRRLSSLLTHRDSARIIGHEYLRVAPAEATPEVLLTLLVDRLPAGHRTLRIASDRELREFLLLAARRDFGEGRTVEVGGWIISLTEARLCALTALSYT